MPKDFSDIEYLIRGSEVQKQGYSAIQNTGVLDVLHEFDPVLAGMLPLDIFIKSSDLDILCYAIDLSVFENILTTNFSKHSDFTIHKTEIKETNTIIARFHALEFDFEIFGQPVPTRNQLAFRHLLVEDKILTMNDDEFKSKIIALKLSGMKTEPAFAHVLNLNGDPYESLLTVPV